VKLLREPLTLEKSCLLEAKKEPKMTSDNRARLRVAALIFVMVNAVVFGVGLVTVLMTPALSQHAFLWIPIVIVSSFVFSPPLAWLIAPMMMQRFIQARRLAGGTGGSSL
jgi:uncharacterized protein (DUF983 family)